MTDPNNKIDKPIPSNQERAQMRSGSPAPAICLVNPQMGENIGAASRAMANFGLEDLVLVAPRDGWPNQKAYDVSSGAAWPLDNAKLVNDTAEAIKDYTMVFATTGTPRQLDKPLIGPMEAVKLIIAALEKGEKPIVLFGAERAGLDNKSINIADYLITMPTDFRFPSLNLAQSVAVFSYVWAAREEIKGAPKGWNINDPIPAKREAFDNMFDFFINELSNKGFFWPEDRKENMVEVLRTPMVRARFSENEINLFRGALRVFSEGSRKRYTDSKKQEIKEWLFINKNIALETINVLIEDTKAIAIANNQFFYFKIDGNIELIS